MVRKRSLFDRGRLLRGARVGWIGALVATSAVVGLLVGLRAIVALHFPALQPLLTIDTLPVERFGIPWSDRATWPADAQALGLYRLARVLAAVILACVAVAAVNTLVILAEASASREDEIAVRSAVGATPLAIVRRLLAELRTFTAVGVALGVVAGLAGGTAARVTWPGTTLPVWSAPWELLLGVGAFLVAMALVQLSGAWHAARSGRVVRYLRAGSRGGQDPAALFLRSSLSVVQLTIAATVMVATLALSTGFARSTQRASGRDGQTPAGVWVASLDASEGDATPSWGELLDRVASVQSVEAESLAAPGALLRLGIRDIAVTQCGECVRGQFPAPLWSAVADHYFVTPGYFDVLGIPLVDGRDFGSADGHDAEPVAIVNRTFAQTSFDSKGPLGRKIRIGSGFEGWYTIVGIVDDAPRAGLGSDGIQREAVYLSAIQRPPRSARLVMRGDADAAAAAIDAARAAGYAMSDPQSVEAYLEAADLPLRWSRSVVLGLSWLVMLLAIHGIHTLATQTTRRRAGELALRRALGASSAAMVRYVLGRRLRIGLWGIAGFAFFGTLTMAFLQEATGIEGPGLLGYAAIGLVLLATTQLAALRAVREALAVEPAALLE